MDLITLDAFMTQLGETSSILLPVAEDVAERAKTDYGLKVDNAEFVLKDAIPEVLEKGTETERTIKSYITTIAKDRDNEAVLPEGAIMDDYNMLKIVLYGHQYDKLGVGKNLWIVANNRHSVEGVYGLIALTKYATIKANPFADQVYNWRMEDMPMGESIGFIPVEYFTPDDKEWSKLFDSWVKRAAAYMQSKTREITDDLFEGLKRIYTKWIMLEYSDVMMPSNAHAVTLAVSKGLLTESEIEQYTIKTELPIITKPETTENYHRIPVAQCKITATITISADQGIKALYCGNEKKVATYLFDKDKWTMAEAKKWVAEHKGDKNALTIGEVLEYHKQLSADDGARYLDIEEECFLRDALARGYTTLDLEWNPADADWMPDDNVNEEKEGRVISAKTRKRIADTRDATQAATEALNALLDETEVVTDDIDIDIESIELEVKDEQIEFPDLTLDEIKEIVVTTLAEPDEIEVVDIPSPQDKARLRRGETI